MARNKSIIKNVSVSVAQRKHCCKRSRKHVIFAGEKRLAVKEGRSTQHYCRECALATLKNAEVAIEELREEFEKTD